MFKNSVRFLLLVSIIGCDNLTEVKEQSAADAVDSIVLSPPNSAVNIRKLPEDFFKKIEVEQWESFDDLQIAIEDLTKLNPEGVGVFLEGILNKTIELQKAPIPEVFDTPQIKSRMKLVQMQTMKSIYFTAHYTKDSLNNSLDQLYQFYNILLDRMLSLTAEEDIFSSSNSDDTQEIKPEPETSLDKSRFFRERR